MVDSVTSVECRHSENKDLDPDTEHQAHKFSLIDEFNNQVTGEQAYVVWKQESQNTGEQSRMWAQNKDDRHEHSIRDKDELKTDNGKTLTLIQKREVFEPQVEHINMINVMAASK